MSSYKVARYGRNIALIYKWAPNPKGATSGRDAILEPLIEKGCEVTYAMVLGRTRVSGSPNYSG